MHQLHADMSTVRVGICHLRKRRRRRRSTEVVEDLISPFKKLIQGFSMKFNAICAASRQKQVLSVSSYTDYSYQHVLTASPSMLPYTSALWHCSLQNALHPSTWGCVRKTVGSLLTLMGSEPLPIAVPELLSCSCTRSCYLSYCSF